MENESKPVSRESNIIFIMLLDFLKDLPQDFDPNKIKLSDAYPIIINFMNKHGLCE